MKKDLIILLIIIAFAKFFVSCDAPRNNPLDPENPQNDIGSIEGIVRTIKVPQSPIDSAKIIWLNDGIIEFTDDEGYFRFDNIGKKSGYLTIEKEGYLTDTILISFNAKTSIQQNIFLNSASKLNQLLFYSITINKFPSEQLYSLDIKADLYDEENDIDSVYFENEDLNISKKLSYNFESKYYENRITPNDLNAQSIDVVIGKEFSISVYNSDSIRYEVGKSIIKRIIKEEIIPTAPLGRDTIETNSPFIEWRKFTPGFDFKYLLQIYTDELEEELVWERELTSDKIQHSVDSQLPSGDYFWVIWAIDEFENRTRSKPSTFIIK